VSLDSNGLRPAEIQMLRMPRLESIGGIVSSKLQKAWIDEAKKVQDWSALGRATKLEWLTISDCHLDTISFLENCRALKRIALVDAKVRDGDMRAVRHVAERVIDHKRHYIYE
jgi:hypothetical protein